MLYQGEHTIPASVWNQKVLGDDVLAAEDQIDGTDFRDKQFDRAVCLLSQAFSPTYLDGSDGFDCMSIVVCDVWWHEDCIDFFFHTQSSDRFVGNPVYTALSVQAGYRLYLVGVF